MKKKTLVIGAVAAATLAGGGLALAHSAGYGPGYGPGNCGGPQQMQGQMGPGMYGQSGFGPHGPGMQGSRGFGRHGGPQFGMLDATRLDNLKTELGIKADQEQAWNAYTKTVQDAATAMKTARTELTTQAQKAAQERQAAQTKMRDTAQKQFATVKTAANDLLGKLDDAQKTNAQQALPGLAFGPGTQAGGPSWHRHWR